jgi:hypothetical protein
MKFDFTLGAYLFHVSFEVGLSLCTYIPKSNCSLDGQIHSVATHTPETNTNKTKPIHLSKDMEGWTSDHYDTSVF